MRIIEEATKSETETPYCDLLFIKEKGDKLSTKLYEKFDGFGFHIIKFPFFSGDIPPSLLYTNLY